MNNLLLPELLPFLEAHPMGCKAYDLMEHFKQHPAFSPLSEHPELGLFQKNFLIMNGLYALKQTLEQEGYFSIDIHVLHIQLKRFKAHDHHFDHSLDTADPLSLYYLDWNNFFQTEAADVSQMLEDFWLKFSRVDERLWAINTLNLEEPFSNQELQRVYRQLAKVHHPDCGGDAKAFMDIHKAYLTLKDP